MKKFLSIVAVTALLLTVLAGCQSAISAQPSETISQQPSTTTPSTAEPAVVTAEPTVTESATTEKKPDSDKISKNEARDIALKHAGPKISQVRNLEVELDKDDGTLHYDVEFEADGYEYDYEIHAESGKILKSQKERD